MAQDVAQVLGGVARLGKSVVRWTVVQSKEGPSDIREVHYFTDGLPIKREGADEPNPPSWSSYLPSRQQLTI